MDEMDVLNRAEMLAGVLRTYCLLNAPLRENGSLMAIVDRLYDLLMTHEENPLLTTIDRQQTYVAPPPTSGQPPEQG